MPRLYTVALLLAVALCTSSAVQLQSRDKPDTKGGSGSGGDPLDPMTTGSMISGAAVFAELEDKPDTKGGSGSGGDPLDPMTTGSMISGAAVFAEIADKPDAKGGSGSGGDPLDPMTTGSMISGAAVFHGDNTELSADPALVEADDAIGPSKWVNNLINSYMKDAKAGRLKGVAKGDMKIVDNNNALKHTEAPEGVDAEERYKKTSEETKKARAEQKSKEQDEAGQKKVEQTAKKGIIALKKQVQEQGVKTDAEQDKKTVQEEKIKVSEADNKKGNEARLKARVTKLKAQAAEEGAKAQRSLAQKKAKEQSEKTAFEQQSKADVQRAVDASKDERRRAAREASKKHESEAQRKREDQARQEKEMKAEQDRKAREAKQKEEKEKEERQAVVQQSAFTVSQGRVIAQNANLLTGTQWKNAFTYTFWIKPSAAISNWGSILHHGAADYQRNPAFFFYPNSLRLHIRSGSVPNAGGWQGGVGNEGCDPAKSLSPNVWTWVAVTHSAGAMRVMFGTGADLTTECTAQLNPSYNNGPLYAGNPWYAAARAQLADVRVYNRALTEAELKEILAKKQGVTD